MNLTLKEPSNLTKLSKLKPGDVFTLGANDRIPRKMRLVLLKPHSNICVSQDFSKPPTKFVYATLCEDSNAFTIFATSDNLDVSLLGPLVDKDLDFGI